MATLTANRLKLVGTSWRGWGRLIAGLLVLLGFTIGSASVSVADVRAKKKYYVTQGADFDGNEALTACDKRYHMASLWEIFDTTNLEYDTTRGRTTADSGIGPCNSDCTGWVRTDNEASTAATAGVGNCDAWMSDSGSHYGTQVYLSRTWNSGAEEASPWTAFAGTCDEKTRV